MSDERSETYLRLRAEVELRRVADQLRGLDAAAGPDDRADPGMRPFATAETAQWKVVRAGRILVAAGALEEEFLALLAADLDGSIRARSRIMLNWDRRRGMLHYTMSFTPSGGPASPAGRGTAQAMRVTPIGRALRLAGDRGPSVLQVMSLVRAGTEAVITAVLRLPWSHGGTELVSPRDLPYDQLWAVDDHGARYPAGFGSGQGRAGTWLGIIRLSPLPPADIRRLDLVGDGTHLIRLPLGPSARARRAVSSAEPVAITPGERLLVLEAERILASGDVRGPVPLADRYQWNWTPGFSWWLRGGTGNWHVAAAGEPHTFGDGIQAFRLRLTPPLDAVPDTAEVVVTGPATRTRATVPIRPA